MEEEDSGEFEIVAKPLPELPALEISDSDLKRERLRPDISVFADAISSDGRPLFSIGDKIVIERVTLDVRRVWFDTKVYFVEDINHLTGDLKLWDIEGRQCARSNFISGPHAGYTFKLTIPAVSDDHVDQIDDQPKEKRGRGRPPGAKNRSKEVIAQEKRERIEKQRLKRERRR